MFGSKMTKDTPSVFMVKALEFKVDTSVVVMALLESHAMLTSMKKTKIVGTWRNRCTISPQQHLTCEEQVVIIVAHALKPVSMSRAWRIGVVVSLPLVLPLMQRRRRRAVPRTEQNGSIANKMEMTWFPI